MCICNLYHLQELTNGQNKFNNKEQTYSLISELLPLLKHIYQNQLNELEVKQGDQGKLQQLPSFFLQLDILLIDLSSRQWIFWCTSSSI